MGDCVGDTVGDCVSDTVGDCVGETVGECVGGLLGSKVGVLSGMQVPHARRHFVLALVLSTPIFPQRAGFFCTQLQFLSIPFLFACLQMSLLTHEHVLQEA